MRHPEFGELEYDEGIGGFAFNRKFGFLSRFVETGREPEYLDESANDLEGKLKDLFDKTPEELEREGIPDEFSQTPLAFILPNQKLFEQFSQELEDLAREMNEVDPELEEEQDDFEDREQIRRGEGGFRITIRTNDPNVPPSEVQLATLERFFQNEESIGQKISEAIFRFYRELQTGQPEFFDIKVDSPDDQVGIIFFSALTVHETEIDGEVLLGLNFDAEWEPEHGVGVSVHKGEVLDIGGWETAEDGPSGELSLWYTLCSSEQQKQIARVTEVLQKKWKELFAEREQDPYYQLVVAFQAGDMDRVRQLFAEGVDINRSDDRHSPLLLDAIHQEVDPEVDTESRIEQLLEMGADPRVKVGGKSILKHAQELLKDLEFSRKFLSSGASQQMFQLMQAQLGPEGRDRPNPATVVNQQMTRMEEVIHLMQNAIDRR